MKARSLSQLASIRRKANRFMRLERVWHELRWPLLLLALWIGASLLHIPQSLPDSLHGLLEAAGVISILWILRRRIRRMPPLTQKEIDTRIEADSNLSFQPLSTLSDVPAVADATASDHHQLIWASHQSRALSVSQKLRVRWPRLFPGRRSKIVIASLLLALSGAFYISAPHTLSRIRAGLLPGTDDDRIPLPTLQAWVDSPSYAPAAPLFLNEATSSYSSPLTEGALLHVIVTDSLGPPRLHGASIRHRQRLSPHSWQIDALMQHSGGVSVHVRGRALSHWHFNVTPDLPPTLSWTGKPAALQGAWQTHLPWKAAQRHGIDSLGVVLSLTPHQRVAAKHSRSIYVPLPLDGHPTHAEAQTDLDLSDSPFAGLTVQGHLQAQSVSGRQSASPSKNFKLGARTFTDPLARALVTLRQRLALETEDKNETQRDIALLTTLTLPRDLHIPLAAINGAFQSSASLETVQEQLWFLALYAEDRAQSGMIMAASMAELRAAQQDVQQQINLIGTASAASLEQQQELHQRLNRVKDDLDTHMKLMIQKASQNGIVMPLPSGKNAPWAKLAKKIEKDALNRNVVLASFQLRQMVAMAEQIRQANVEDMQSLSQQMEAHAEASAQKFALSDLIKRETQLLNQTQARLAAIHQKVTAMQQTTDVSQMSTPDLFQQLGMGANPSPSPEDETQLDSATREKHTLERQANHATQHALRALDHILTHRSKALSGKDNQGFKKAATDMGTVLHELAQKHDDAAAIAERKVLEDLSQARDEEKKNQKSSSKNKQGRLGFIPPPQAGQGQGNDQSDGQGSDSQGSGSAQQGQDQDKDLDPQDDDSDADDSQDGDTQEQKKTPDPLGRKAHNGPETDAHIPDHDNDRARAIERELQRRAADRTRPQSELDYLNRLLTPFRQKP